MSEDLLAALALVIVLEGTLYALFPAFAKRLAKEALSMPEGTMRIFGLCAVGFGVLIVWLVRG